MTGASDVVWRGIGTLFVVFLLSPLALVVLFAFTSRPQSAFPIEALSLRWWDAMLANPNFAPAFWNSLIISGTVGIVSAIVGTMAALGLARLDPRRAQLAAALLCLPLMLPPLVLGVALLSFYSRVRVPMGPQTVIMSHLLFALPFVVLVVYARLRNFDFRVVESARDLGRPRCGPSSRSRCRLSARRWSAPRSSPWRCPSTISSSPSSPSARA